MLAQQNKKRSWIEIDIRQLENNCRAFKEALPPDADVMAVVKANAYGHGDTVVARALENVGVHLFAVVTVDEAVQLRKAGVGGEILVLGYTPVDWADLLHEYDITQTLLSEDYARLLSEATAHKLKCQFAVDTGMNRIGLDAADVSRCAKTIRAYADRFTLTGLFTHLCVADSQRPSDVTFTEMQLARFDRVAQSVSDLALPYVHCLNSAGGLYYADAVCDRYPIVRLGIALYGLHPSDEIALPDGVRPVLTWKTVVAMVKTVRAGESVGYGRRYTAQKDMRVATLPTGYADGYSRALSGKGYVLIRGRRAPVLGSICMDQMMVDVTDIPDVAMGEPVVLIGESGAERITADDMAAMLGTIGYEVVCNISARVERVYV